MTHSIGSGTVNLCVNLPRDGRDILGRAAFQCGETVGEFVRRLLPVALEDEARRLEDFDPHAAQSLKRSAEELRAVHRQYYGGMMLAVFLAGLCCGLEVARRRVIEERLEVREECA